MSLLSGSHGGIFTYENMSKSDKGTVVKLETGIYKTRYGIAKFSSDKNILYLEDRHYNKKGDIWLGSDGKEYQRMKDMFTCSNGAQWKNVKDIEDEIHCILHNIK